MTKDSDASQNDQTILQHENASFFRRLGVWVYDFLIIVAILLLAALLGILALQALIAFGLFQLPETIDASEYLRNNWLYQGYLCFCSFQ